MVENNGIEECTACDGLGVIIDEDYVTGDCPYCDTRGFVHVAIEEE